MMKNKNEAVMDWFIAGFALLIVVMAIYPLYYALVFSLNSGIDIDANGFVYFLPRIWTLDNYIVVFSDGSILSALLVTVLRTVIGTGASVLFSAMVAYPLSRKGLRFRKLYMVLWVITMYFNGGIIPYYLVLNSLHLINSFAVYVLPWMFGAFNGILFVNFFKQVPDSLQESAHIDGANDFLIFIRIMLPLSAPVLATVTLFSGVAQWNSWFDAAYFTSSPGLQTLQSYLWKVISKAQSLGLILKYMKVQGVHMNNNTTIHSLEYATMIVSIIPIALVYPFLQKYFIKGFMLGAVKE